MSIVCHPVLPDEYTITPSTRSFTLEWNIHSSTPLDPNSVALAAETPSVGDRCPYISYLFAQTVAFRPAGDAYHWTARVEYGHNTIEGEYKSDRPWDNPPDIRNTVEFEQVTQDYEYVDAYEKEEIGEDGEPFTTIHYTRPLLNILNELYNPAPTRRIPIKITQIRWYVRQWKESWAEQFLDSVNWTPVVLDGQNRERFTLWCTQLLANRYYYSGDNWCYQIDAEFRYKEGGWRYKPIQASYHAKNPETSKIEDIFEKDGVLYYASEVPASGSGYSRISEPVLLNENGGLLVEYKEDIPSNLNNIRYGNHRLLGGMDWTGLKIPAMKGNHV